MELETVQLNMGGAVVDLPETRVLRLEGSWTVRRAHELKQILMDALESAESCVLELEDLEEADISFLQLLCATHRASLRLGKSVMIHDKRSVFLKQLVYDAGFKRNLGCHKDPRVGCLWMGEWEPWTRQS
jgi:ABC-type transporter Mla MlaB component